MKATGIVRKVDDLGRIVIPKELRKVLGLNEGDPLEIFSDEGSIILRPYRAGCFCCGETDNLTTVKDVALCPNCINTFSQLLGK